MGIEIEWGKTPTEPGTLWATQALDPGWTAKFRIDRGGVPVELRVIYRPTTPRATVSPPLTARIIRQATVARVSRQVREEVRHWMAHDPAAILARAERQAAAFAAKGHVEKAEELRERVLGHPNILRMLHEELNRGGALVKPPPTPGTARTSPQLLAEIAQCYTTAAEARQPPLVAIEKELKISRTYARDLVRRARHFGYLIPRSVTRGTVDGRMTDLARKTLAVTAREPVAIARKPGTRSRRRRAEGPR